MPMTEIPIGYVGVVISFVGKEHVDLSGDDFNHGDLVNAATRACGSRRCYPASTRSTPA